MGTDEKDDKEGSHTAVKYNAFKIGSERSSISPPCSVSVNGLQGIIPVRDCIGGVMRSECRNDTERRMDGGKRTRQGGSDGNMRSPGHVGI